MSVLEVFPAVLPPVAMKRRTTSALHGDTRVDDYAWLRDKTDPETLAYLEAENAYADAVMKPTEPLQDQLYDEMLGRIQQTDMNVPFRKDGWFYYTRTEEGKQYPIYARRNERVDEEILLDVNVLAEGHEFMAVGEMQVSDDAHLLAYTTDDSGYREFRLHVKDLRTGTTTENLAEHVETVEWAADTATLFYSVENETKRQSRIYRHRLGTAEHHLVFEEQDELYDVFVDRSRSGAWLFVVSDSKTTSEVRLLPARSPEAEPAVMVPRRDEHKYYADHRGDRFYILTNDAGINFRVVTAPVADPREENWQELVPYREPVRIETIDLFANHMVVRLREGGLSQLEIHDLRDGAGGLKPALHRVSFPEVAYTLAPSYNEEFDAKVYRYTYQSFITPPSVYDYDLDTREQTLLKRTEVLGGYDPSQYAVERFFVEAADGARIPVSLVYRRDLDPRGAHPLMLYAYGSYGASMSPTFSHGRFSLIDRGVTWALANVRGGGEMGKEWHEQGRMMSKKNTFSDFIAVCEHLCDAGYTSPDKLVIQGGSAGGLLVGAVVNMRPELFRALLAYVPFVDVMNTMLDATLPLTTQEYIEWGNPNEADAYFYMKSYDPYSNVEPKAYPAMLVRASLNDSQVGYWEAAKWVARLRDSKTDGNTLLLRVNMGAGHGGASGRYDKLREDAHDYAWVLRELRIE
ncbi:MAG TPA: S9 family peptidase [Thermoanaerobaculia bacterium]|nr:S9 family peptidase [Thermoanaerobaculia bacterium]